MAQLFSLFLHQMLFKVSSLNWGHRLGFEAIDA